MATQSGAQEFLKYEEMGAYHWRELVPSWRVSFNPYLKARYEVAQEALDALEISGHAADLGCGDGYFTHILAKKGLAVTGVDGSEAALKMAQQELSRRSLQADFRVQNVCATGIDSATQDLIVSLDVIEHLEDADAFMREIARIAKKGAWILIGTPVRFTEKPLDRFHVREFFPDEFRTFIQKYAQVQTHILSHPFEYLALMKKKLRFLGREKNLGWNLLNFYVTLTGRNPFKTRDSAFPTYQFIAARFSQ